MQWEITEAGKVIHKTEWQPVTSRVIGRDKKGIEIGGQLALALQSGVYELRITVSDSKSKHSKPHRCFCDRGLIDLMPDSLRSCLDWYRAVNPDNEVEIKALEADGGRGYVCAVGRRNGQVELSDQIVSLPENYSGNLCSAIVSRHLRTSCSTALVVRRILALI